MKYLIKGTAIKFNHKVYEIGDEITLTSVPKSLKHLLEPIKGNVIPESKVIPDSDPESHKTVIPERSNRESKEPVIPVSLKPESIKTKKRKKTEK
jgi:hypothetical protein